MPKPFTGSMTNADGYALLIPSQLVGAMVAAPFAVCFTDVNGNEYTVTGDTLSTELAAPIPVVLCDSTGHAVTPPLTITSNSNTLTVSSTLTGRKLPTPTAIVLCDANGNPVTLTGVTTGSYVTNPASCVLCDTTGKSLTATYSANVIVAGGLFQLDFHEQSGGVAHNILNAQVNPEINQLSCGQRNFKSLDCWRVSSGSITITDNFTLGPDGVNTSATRLQAGGATAVLVVGGASLLNIAAHTAVTFSCSLKLNTGTSATITPDVTGPNSTGSWAVTNAWQRFSFSVANPAVAVTGVAIFLPASTDLLVYGMQLENAASASAYDIPTLDFVFGSTGPTGTDIPTWAGNGTLTSSSNAKRAIALSDADLTMSTCTAYVAVKSSSTTPQVYGRTLAMVGANAASGTEPQAFEIQTSWWNAASASPTLAGGSRNRDPFIGFGGLSREFPSGNLFDQTWHILAAVCDGTTVHLYVDGILIDSPSASPATGTPASITAGLFMLGDTNSANHGFPGSYAHVSFYKNTVHTYSQVKQQTAAIAALMTANGLSPVLGVQNGLVVFEGDSITDGISTGNVGHPALVAANYGITVVNYGHSGDQVAQLTARATTLDALIDTSKAYNILVVMIGRNDLDHVSAGTFETNLQTYCSARRTAGWAVVVCTLLPTTGATAGPLIPGVNTWIRANYPNFADALADPGGDATLNAQVANTAYFYDGTHPTALAYTIVAPYIETAINGLPAHP